MPVNLLVHPTPITDCPPFATTMPAIKQPQDLLWRNYVSSENKIYNLRSARLSTANIMGSAPCGRHRDSFDQTGKEVMKKLPIPNGGGAGSPLSGSGSARSLASSRPSTAGGPLRSGRGGANGARSLPQLAVPPAGGGGGGGMADGGDGNGHPDPSDGSAGGSFSGAPRWNGRDQGRGGGALARGGNNSSRLARADVRARQQKLRLRVLERQLENERLEKERWMQSAKQADVEKSKLMAQVLDRQAKLEENLKRMSTKFDGAAALASQISKHPHATFPSGLYGHPATAKQVQARHHPRPGTTSGMPSGARAWAQRGHAADFPSK